MRSHATRITPLPATAQTHVALDLETTGLGAERDAIIEIGAIKFKGDQIEGEFSTTVTFEAT
jgi:DNA polymerase III epsilon subunit-like protein